MADPIFRALTRPQMVAGVSYQFCVINGTIGVMLFILFKSAWVLPLPLLIHALGYAAHLRDPNIMSLLLTRLRRTPRVKNYRLRGANVYCP